MKRLIAPLIVCGIALTLVVNPLAQVLWPDSYKYIDMALGIGANAPWAFRPLVPFLAGVVSSLFGVNIPLAFLALNTSFFALAGLLILRTFNLTTAVVTMACMSPAVTIFGVPLLDAAIFMFVAVALFLREWAYPLMVWTMLSAAVHPMAFALCMVVLMFSAFENSLPYLFFFPPVIFMLFFWPSTYTTLLLPELNDLLYSLKVLNALWLGLLFLRKDRESLLVVVMLAACLFFVPFLTMPARAFSPMALVLGPMLVKETRRKPSPTEHINQPHKWICYWKATKGEDEE